MGFRLGDKISAGLESSARIGKKVLGETSRIGHKISSEGGKAISIVERVPILGAALAPATGVARSALGLVQNVADLAQTGETLLTGAEGVVRAGSEAIRTGDTLSAMDALRRGKDLKGSTQSSLERARKVATDAGALGRSSGSAFAQTRGNLNRGMVGKVMGSLTDP
tara:strand:- start:3118 stop:3618 length:501 start_codon:yes stop_codon:yes gene_type:complete